ncbi:glycosyltransferase [Proteiniclasticum sp.]|uniref:glycosyltransferase n=1 Tax=Proteiniclasticum sp. TaxID=2053595 RepID=UPI0028A1EECD|nr:glycosyltransferase [Proteiniclasticum sp.]
MQKKLTLVICTYNGEKYLDEVIESIIFQKGFEDHVEKLKIVDNASSDNTKNIICKYQSINPRIEYIYEGNPGLSHARKHGALVDTEWIAYLDDDNILLPEWINEALSFISNNPKVGVFNGASIATIRDEITKKEVVMLNAIYQDLACTHVRMEDYDLNLLPAIKGPFGAGMVLRAKPLKKFLDNGWTSNIGRQGKALGSGEDGEIANYVLEEGFDYGYNNQMALLHIIPKVRLQPIYVEKLMKGLNEGYYNYISGKKNFIFYRFKTFIKSVYVLLSNPIRLVLTSDEIKKLKYKLEIDSRKRISKMIINDLFVIKR